MDKLKPGYCERHTIWHEDLRLFEKIADFCIPYGNCADIGEKNAKMEYLKRIWTFECKQIESQDFNWMHDVLGKYDTIFCFEVLEHLQNPLHFLRKLKDSLKDNGHIYLSMPGRPKFLWTEHHFREYTPKEFEKWLLNPLGLRIARKKRIRINHKPLFYISGIRPFFRLFFNYTNIYEIKLDNLQE